jgi:hypothetical protein
MITRPSNGRVFEWQEFLNLDSTDSAYLRAPIEYYKQMATQRALCAVRRLGGVDKPYPFPFLRVLYYARTEDH